LLLAGDASFDPRDYLGYAADDKIPTWIETSGPNETAYDDYFADLDEDGYPDLSVGRLTVQTEEQAKEAVNKILGYERQRRDSENNRVLLISDEQGDFDFRLETERIAKDLAQHLEVETISRNQLATAEELHRRLEEGYLIINYLGHGSVGRWAGQMLTTTAAHEMSNTNKLPLILSMSCLTGRYHGERESLAEATVNNPEGGAIAMIASASLDGAWNQVQLDEALLRQLFSKNLTLGEVLKNAKSETGTTATAKSYLLIGDPLIRLRPDRSASRPGPGWVSRRR
jgi:hypothetical protein